MQSAGMIFYILLFGIISSCIWIKLNRDHAENDIKTYSLKSVLFFFASIYFTASALKFYLGEAENTLPESFWDIEETTYLHYGIIFIVISIAAPLLMKRLFSSYGYQLVHNFDFICVIVIMVCLLLSGRIDNRTYCILYVACLLAGFGITLLYRQRIEYIGMTEIRHSFLENLPFVGAWVVMTGIYFPNELYIHNLEEFAGNYAVFFLIMLAGSIIEIFLLVMVGLVFLPKNLFKMIYLLFAGMTCAGYIQSMFLNGTLNDMNGEKQVWSGQKLLVNTCMWLAILLISAIGGYRRTFVWKMCRLFCIYISLIQIATLGWLILTSDRNSEYENTAITNRGALELAQENNVLVFVLDNFDSSWFEEIYQEDSSILEPLSDFTYYRNGTSQFAHTNNAIPYMLTGAEWNADETDYFHYAYENSNVMNQIATQGINIRIFTDAALMPKELCQKMDNYSESVIRNYKIGKTYYTMLRTSMYKVAPFLMKPLYEYYSSDINDMSYNNDIWSIDNDLLFYQNIVGNGLSISEKDKNAFRFYHMRGPHAPFYLTEDLKYESTGRVSTLHSQGKGSLKIVYTFIEQMKALGIYEDATIIITADHGQSNIWDSKKDQGKPDKTSRTLFLVKRPDEHHGNMEISESPVSQAELIPTVLKALGIENASYGRTFEEIAVDEKRVRKYVDVYSDYKIEYEIDGHAADLDNWSIVSEIYY